MKSRTEYTLALDEVPGSDPDIIGGKGVKLGEMRRAGLPVPEGFVVTTKAFESFMSTNGLWEKVDRVVGGACTGSDARLRRLSAIARTLLQASPVPKDVADGIATSYRMLCVDANDTPAAVRSSTVPEEPYQSNRARKDLTVLNVNGISRILGAVRKCWSSVFEQGELPRRLENEPRLRRPTMAAVVQTLVRSEKAGFGFCVDPASGEPSSLIIESVFGQRDDLSPGGTAHDSFVVDRGSGLIMESKVADKRTMCVALDRTGFTRVEVPAYLRKKPSLSPKELDSIWRLSGLLEAHYGCPQDFEWAIGRDSLSLLNARPAAVLQFGQPMLSTRAPGAH